MTIKIVLLKPKEYSEKCVSDLIECIKNKDKFFGQPKIKYIFITCEHFYINSIEEKSNEELKGDEKGASSKKIVWPVDFKEYLKNMQALKEVVKNNKNVLCFIHSIVGIHNTKEAEEYKKFHTEIKKSIEGWQRYLKKEHERESDLFNRPIPEIEKPISIEEIKKREFPLFFSVTNGFCGDSEEEYLAFKTQNALPEGFDSVGNLFSMGNFDLSKTNEFLKKDNKVPLDEIAFKSAMSTMSPILQHYKNAYVKHMDPKEERSGKEKEELKKNMPYAFYREAVQRENEEKEKRLSNQLRSGLYFSGFPNPKAEFKSENFPEIFWVRVCADAQLFSSNFLVSEDTPNYFIIQSDQYPPGRDAILEQGIPSILFHPEAQWPDKSYNVNFLYKDEMKLFINAAKGDLTQSQKEHQDQEKHREDCVNTGAIYTKGKQGSITFLEKKKLEPSKEKLKFIECEYYDFKGMSSYKNFDEDPYKNVKKNFNRK